MLTTYQGQNPQGRNNSTSDPSSNDGLDPALHSSSSGESLNQQKNYLVLMLIIYNYMHRNVDLVERL